MIGTWSITQIKLLGGFTGLVEVLSMQTQFMTKLPKTTLAVPVRIAIPVSE